MIVFDLCCGQGHVFEVWFGSSQDYQTQKERGLVECPICGDTRVEKAVMAPAVSSKGNRLVTPNEQKARADEIARIKADVEANCDYVGSRFVEEARARHEAKNERGIYGEATLADTLNLIEEGINVTPLPFRPKQTTNA